MGPRLVPGMVIGETFTILRLIGRGGMGEVYEAEHVRLKGRVALKLLRLDVAADAEPYLRFRQEAEITSALRHPHIVQVLDFNEHEGVPYIVMERLEGTDLATRLRLGGPLPLRAVVALVDQVASALGAAHSKGVIHRDLTPQNIFLVHVSGQGREFAKVMDFGISKVRSAAKVISDEFSLLGTPAYMSPEQAIASIELDGRSDEFALATITYEALCGQQAFHGTALEMVLHEVLHKEPRSLARRVPGLPPGVDPVVKRGMSKACDDRYPTIVAFAAALQAASEPGLQAPTAAAPAPDTAGGSPAAPAILDGASGGNASTPTTAPLGVAALVASAATSRPTASSLDGAGPADGEGGAGSSTPATPSLGGAARAGRGDGGQNPTPTTAPLGGAPTADAAVASASSSPAGSVAAANTPPSGSGVYVLVDEAEALRSAAAGRWRRLATIAGATLAGGAIALAVAAFVLRAQIREARLRASQAPVTEPVPRKAPEQRPERRDEPPAGARAPSAP